MRYHIVTFLIGAVAALGGAAMARGEFDMRQENFPCVEDEVLAYSPQFGPDRVGCLHIEEVK